MITEEIDVPHFNDFRVGLMIKMDTNMIKAFSIQQWWYNGYLLIKGWWYTTNKINKLGLANKIK
jgi:hypothetical protein